MDDSMGIIGTLLGILLGGYMTWFLGSEQRKHDRSKENRVLLLSKYEELHELLGQVNGCVTSLAMQIVSEAAMDSKFDPKAIKNAMPTEKGHSILYGFGIKFRIHCGFRYYLHC